ncbi:flagellar export protein FliJ [Verminephrobacter eiseniae]|uniref:flagellar export protein FliJ n=1 Tax=Verminephrobacter eiseniae TaxID=364317 RepID=UPI002237805D|nr:flagellar export protein FliJ [Verminephrobacter eiseniae]MCW5233958.1 flagellar export protein FliJ [Verminephrobacter eiseniae]MCW5294486.1 flagellar export protein FliJ [Verminephrobacter eiseniae]MCW8187033.1 flagellar export protein FliJ [Verminephrobacter eiseniae]MCW8225434.1 flagellar export protein FliJ [Verminephrobacter eiseniae]MCW8236424.1 flagellar export protein FliJ [Verminephrobacter eiseniae]
MSDTLAVALELATRQRDAASKVLQALLAAQRAARARLGQLQDYARDTESRWGMQAGARLQPEVLYHHDRFIERLDEAARIQAGLLSAQSEHVASARGALRAAQLRLASLRQLMQRRSDAMAQQQRRRDQQQTDEWSALRYRDARRGFQEQEH